MAELISTAVALVAAFLLGYGIRGEREKATRRTQAARTAALEAANTRLCDQLRVSLAISEHYLKKQFADDLAKRAAEGPLPGFEQSVRSLYVYSSLARTPQNIPPIIGGSGV